MSVMGNVTLFSESDSFGSSQQWVDSFDSQMTRCRYSFTKTYTFYNILTSDCFYLAEIVSWNLHYKSEWTICAAVSVIYYKDLFFTTNDPVKHVNNEKEK